MHLPPLPIGTAVAIFAAFFFGAGAVFGVVVYWLLS